MLGTAEDIAGKSLFDDLAVLHDGHAIRDLRDDGEVMRDEKDREVMASAQVSEKAEDLSLYGNVEGRRRFVGDEKAGTVDDGHGDENALALTAGELVGIVAETAFGIGEGDLVHCFQDLFFDELTG